MFFFLLFDGKQLKTSITYFCFQLGLFLPFSREWINNSRNKQVFIVVRGAVSIPWSGSKPVKFRNCVTSRLKLVTLVIQHYFASHPS